MEDEGCDFAFERVYIQLGSPAWSRCSQAVLEEAEVTLVTHVSKHIYELLFITQEAHAKLLLRINYKKGLVEKLNAMV